MILQAFSKLSPNFGPGLPLPFNSYAEGSGPELSVPVNTCSIFLAEVTEALNEVKWLHTSYTDCEMAR